ncbi:hypothetical protein, partial [Streptomyces scabiei]|uniref:hypothetical protein n=1 Tax=Streptomyces scabiei TaxID=1930 RepID=UPI0029ADDC66
WGGVVVRGIVGFGRFSVVAWDASDRYNHGGRAMKPEIVISVSATVIALASLWVSFTESRSTRAHNRQSVRPLLQIRRVKNAEGGRTGIQVLNAGLGPALVTGTTVWLDGAEIGGWGHESHRLITAGLSVEPRHSTLPRGLPLLTGKELPLLVLDDFDPVAHEPFWRLVTERLRIEIRYESLYGGEEFRAVKGPRQQ